MTRIRVVLTIGACASVFLAPPWLPLILSGILTLRYRAWEVIGVGLLIDLLYLGPAGFYGVPLPATMLLGLALIGFEPFRRQLSL